MKNILVIGLLITTNGCLAQLMDQFSDGDFTDSPNWSGHSTHFVVNSSHQLQLNNSVAGFSFLTTPFESTGLDNYEWNFYVKQTFSPSGSNYGRIYLASTQSNLTQPLNGYYLQLGEAGSADAVELFRQSGTVTNSICRAANAMISSSFAIRIRVTRDAAALWKLMIDYTGGASFVTEASGLDSTFTSCSFLGLLCVYTAGNANKFFFDDIGAGPPPGDTTAPVVQSLSAPSPSELVLTFSERLDSAYAGVLANYQVNQGVGYPISAILQSDQKSLYLTFSSYFVNGAIYQLSISGVLDEAQNMIVPASHDFRHFVAQPATFNDLVITELLPDPTPQIGLPAQEFIEIFNRSDKPFDLAGWKLSDPGTTASLPSLLILPGEYLVLTNSTAVPDYSLFGMTLGLSNFPTLNNSGDIIKLSDPNGLTIDSLDYSSAWYQDDDKSQGGYTLERLNPENPTNEPTNWMGSEAIGGGTPGTQNSVFGKNPDSRPPQVIALEVVNDTTLIVTFDEEIAETTIENYFVDHSVGRPLFVLPLTGAMVKVWMETGFVNGLDHRVTISGIKDLAGNEMTSVDIDFRFFLPGEIVAGIILINEIMADPTPVVQLPEAEFIEVVNVTSFPYDLGGWKLSDATSTITLPSGVVLPGEILVVTSTTNVALFSPYGKVLGVSNFPTLSNSGEGVTLKSTAGVLIDSVNYHLSWYGDKAKEEGGWSLERLLFNFSSSHHTNWRASEDDTGGTPGRQNSVFGKNPDNKAPELSSLEVVTQNELYLEFNEPMDSLHMGSQLFSVGNLGYPTSVSLSGDSKFISLHFATLFQNGVKYSLSVSGLMDMAGNLIADAETSFMYFKSGEVRPKDIMITEIMADPTPTVQLPEAEYIEIYNRVDHPIDLGGWKLSDTHSTAELPSEIIFPTQFLILTSMTNLPKFSTDGNTIGVPNFPSLDNEGDQLILLGADGKTIDSVNYSSDWYRSREKADGGWSLELIDPGNPCAEEDNWRAADSERGGTPGQENSVLANKPDVQGPRLVSGFPGGNQSIHAVFDEKLDKASVVVGSFLIEPPAEISHVEFPDPALRIVDIILESPLQARVLYHLRVVEVRDCNQNAILDAFNTVAFAVSEKTEASDVIINEILFNPKPNGVDFIEAFNRSPKFINLKNWKLANVEEGEVTGEKLISTVDNVLAPYCYRVFTADPLTVKNDYPLAKEDVFTIASLPAMPDDEGIVALIDEEENTIDLFAYSDRLHSPLIKDNEGVSLERVSTEFSSGNQANWRSANSSAGYATPGYLNSNSRPEEIVDSDEVVISPVVVCPGSSDGFAQIHFRFEQSGYMANVRVYDVEGRFIKEIANNESIGFEGFFRWDGDRDDGTKARSGYYIIWFEIFNLDGYWRTFRKRVIITM